MLRSLKANPAESIGSFRMEVADLRKFAVLNYIAVIKSVKKRNRHLATACASGTVGPAGVAACSSTTSSVLHVNGMFHVNSNRGRCLHTTPALQLLCRQVMPMRAVELLSQQYFFTSPKLAALATEAEILQKVGPRPLSLHHRIPTARSSSEAKQRQEASLQQLRIWYRCSSLQVCSVCAAAWSMLPGSRCAAASPVLQSPTEAGG